MKILSPQTPLYITWALLVGAIIISLFEEGQWHTMLMAILTLVVTIIPLLFQKKFNVYLPPILISFVAFFAYATLFLGEVGGYYQKFWWWDLALHLSSAIGFGLLAVIFILLIFGKKRNEAHPLFFALLVFCFSMTMGVLWEIYEFAMDQIFGFNMQKSGLLDTMTDLIINCIGAGIASFAGYLYLFDTPHNPLSRFIDRGYVANKALFKRAKRIENEKNEDSDTGETKDVSDE